MNASHTPWHGWSWCATRATRDERSLATLRKARHGDQIDAVAVARAVGQVMPQVRAVDAHTLAVGQHAHVVPVDLLGVGVGFRVGDGPRVTLG